MRCTTRGHRERGATECVMTATHGGWREGDGEREGAMYRKKGKGEGVGGREEGEGVGGQGGRGEGRGRENRWTGKERRERWGWQREKRIQKWIRDEAEWAEGMGRRDKAEVGGKEIDKGNRRGNKVMDKGEMRWGGEDIDSVARKRGRAMWMFAALIGNR